MRVLCALVVHLQGIRVVYAKLLAMDVEHVEIPIPIVRTQKKSKDYRARVRAPL